MTTTTATATHAESAAACNAALALYREADIYARRMCGTLLRSAQEAHKVGNYEQAVKQAKHAADGLGPLS
jgi:hypothetical protein